MPISVRVKRPVHHRHSNIIKLIKNTMSDAPAISKSNRKVKIHRSTIPDEKKNIILGHLNDALDKFTIEKDVATYLKKRCDEGLTGTWHSIVGRNFGCSITHDTKYVLFLQIDQMHVLIFKSLE